MFGGTSSGAALEKAARAQGLVTDAAATAPTGSFHLAHEAGTDRLCFVPRAEPGARFAFGIETRAGMREYCRGRGVASHVGGQLVLDFEGARRCLVVARYDGDRIALPGTVDLACQSLCRGRASLAGTSVGRVSGDQAGAVAERDSKGAPLCPA